MTTRGWWPPFNGSDYFVSIARPGTGESQKRETRRPSRRPDALSEMSWIASLGTHRLGATVALVSRRQVAQGRNENEMNLDERLEALTMSLERMPRETEAHSKQIEEHSKQIE